MELTKRQHGLPITRQSLLFGNGFFGQLPEHRGRLGSIAKFFWKVLGRGACFDNLQLSLIVNLADPFPWPATTHGLIIFGRFNRKPKCLG